MIALIPLRGGSKRIPKKNIKLMAGKPLAQWVIDAANEANIFDKVIVSTDCEEIACTVKNAEIIKRPSQYAKDDSPTEDVMLHLLEECGIRFRALFTIQATSPELLSQDLIKAANQFYNCSLDSLFSGHRIKKFLWNDSIKPLNYNPKKRPMSQDWLGTIVENGAFWITARWILKEDRCRLGGNTAAYLMNPIEDIDTIDDWEKAEKKLLRRFNNG